MHKTKPFVARATGLAGVAVAAMAAALVACGGGGGNPETELPAAVSNFRLPHSGITASQCYQAGSDTLVACDSPEAIALSGAGKQDGMYASVNAMSYSEVPGHSREECVKDNVTGLVWEGKTASGLRAGSNSYTNYDSTTQAQKYTGNGIRIGGVTPTFAEINAATNTVGYVAYVNSIALCGYTNWRLPLVEELQTIVDYSKTYPGPMLDTAWFPNTQFSNTQQSVYWTITPIADCASCAWIVDFSNGIVDSGLTYPSVGRESSNHVRLVRASP